MDVGKQHSAGESQAAWERASKEIAELNEGGWSSRRKVEEVTVMETE